jgi:hypothetical protein
MSFTTLTLTGTIETSPGSPVGEAVITAVLSHTISDGVSDIGIAPIIAKSASNGTFSLTVQANDDSTTVPQSTYYNFTVATGAGQVLDQFSAVVPSADAPTVSLFALARLSGAPSPATPYVVSVNGSSGILTLDIPDPSPWVVFDFPGSLVSDTTSDIAPCIATVTLTKAVIAAVTQGSSNSTVELIKSGSNNQSLIYDYNGAVVQSYTLDPPITLDAGSDYLQVEVSSAGTAAAGLSVVVM